MQIAKFMSKFQYTVLTNIYCIWHGAKHILNTLFNRKNSSHYV